MNKLDVLFLDIYRSIRGDWSGGIKMRGETMIKLLSKTTLSKDLQKFFKKHFEAMIKAFDSDYFDGRDWARDTDNSYEDLMKSKWFDKKYYKKLSIYDKDFEDFTTMFPGFTCNNYMVNFMMPQLRGGEPNKEALNNHSNSTITVTKEMVNKFLGEKIF